MEEINKKQENQPKIIETEEKFWDAVTDAKNQFVYMSLQLHLTQNENDLLEKNKEMTYLSLKDYLLDQKNLVLSKKILANENAQGVINIYDDLINRIKKFKTKPELEQILEEYREFLQPFKLGL